jgi:hypothetical protein
MIVMLEKIKADLALLKWMVGTNIVLMLVLLTALVFISASAGAEPIASSEISHRFGNAPPARAGLN